MSTVGHTPTPWHINGRYIQRGNRIVAELWAKKNSKQVEVNAAFIVRACNNFEQLLEACKAVIGAVCFGQPNFMKREGAYWQFCEGDPIMVALEAALAAAEVEDIEEEKTQQIYDPVTEQWIEVKE